MLGQIEDERFGFARGRERDARFPADGRAVSFGERDVAETDPPARHLHPGHPAVRDVDGRVSSRGEPDGSNGGVLEHADGAGIAAGDRGDRRVVEPDRLLLVARGQPLTLGDDPVSGGSARARSTTD